MSGDYTVRLEKVFQGPLDLLLHLVREHEVEIQEIEISRILDDYLAYLEKLESLDLEIAGDFLVMAATLMAIKSRSLLPNEEVNLEEELDPRDELIQQLLEYRRFRSASEALGEGAEERARQVERGYRERPPATEREFELGELTVWDLLSVFSRLMRETLADRRHHVQGDPRPLRYYVDHVVHHLRASSGSSLRSLAKTFDGVPKREALIGSFCALLELVRLELIRILPSEDEDDIRLEIHPDHTGDLEHVVDEAVIDEEDLRHGGEHSAESDDGAPSEDAHWAEGGDADDSDDAAASGVAEEESTGELEAPPETLDDDATPRTNGTPAAPPAGEALAPTPTEPAETGAESHGGEAAPGEDADGGASPSPERDESEATPGDPERR